MARGLKVLAIHGVGHQEVRRAEWIPEWQQIIRRGLRGAAIETGRTDVHPTFEFFLYDRVFQKPAYPLNGAAYWTALRELGTAMFFRQMAGEVPRTRGLFDRFQEGFRWTVGIVAQWVAYPRLRQELNEALREQIRAIQPDVVLAHSLGSLISYDTLSQMPGAKQPGMLVTFGSQIGHPAVLGSVLGGRLAMPPLDRWFHLFNPHDTVFTTELRIPDPAFQQIETPFDLPFDPANHSGADYLRHGRTGRVWEAVISNGRSEVTRRALGGLFTQERQGGSMYRALIIGVDEYANPESNLEGCANDAYLMSATLQELGFPAEQIRLILNRRATSTAIRDRLEWLLDDVRPGDVRFLHYSGHGAQIPAYGPNAEIDQFDECLAPHDFDWSPQRAILDDWFYARYSQLPYDARFVAVFDCCHSGGLTRAGGIRVRGLNPPDDIRHRALAYDQETGWQPRELAPMDVSISGRRKLKRLLVGPEGSTHRLGTALPLRQTQTLNEYRQAQKKYGHQGPYLPVLLHACLESELAEEVRIGSTAHGGFTYHLTRTLRKLRRTQPRFTFRTLVTATTQAMERAGLSQQPQLVGPSGVVTKAVPYAKRARGARA